MINTYYWKQNMALTPLLIDIGSLPNDGTGDPLRVAFDKINNNTARLAELSASGDEGSIQFKEGNHFGGSANLIFDSTNNYLGVGADIVPLGNTAPSIGTYNNRFDNVFLANSALRVGNARFMESGNTLAIVNSANSDIKFNVSTGNLSTNNIVIGANNTISVGNISVSGGFTANTTTNTQNQIIWEIPFTQISTGTFEIRTREQNSLNSQFGKIRFMTQNDSAQVKYVIYGTVFNGLALTHYHVDRGYGNIRVMVSPFYNSNMSHRITYTKDL